MPKNLFKIAREKKIKYFLISFVDLFGVLRSKLVPAHAIKDMQETGAGFAGFAAWLDMTPADSDMFGIPDPDSLIQLPWNKEVGWLASDLWMNGKPVDASPRVMLKKQIKELSRKGLIMKSGVECEYFLISPDGNSIADPRDTQSKPCYDQSALMRRYDLIKEICNENQNMLIEQSYFKERLMPILNLSNDLEWNYLYENWIKKIIFRTRILD